MNTFDLSSMERGLPTVQNPIDDLNIPTICKTQATTTEVPFIPDVPSSSGATQEIRGQIATVAGKVVLVERAERLSDGWTNPNFVIFAPRDRKTFYVAYDGFCHVMVEDAIEARGYITTSTEPSRDYDMRLVETPIVEPGINEETIRKAIAGVFPRMGALGVGEAKRIYERLARKTGSMEEYQGHSAPNRVNLYINRLSIEFIKRKQDSGATEAFEPELDKAKASKLLNFWYNKRIVRQLRMIGLTYEEVRESDIEPHILYDKLKRNPYTVPFISLERCNTLCQKFGIMPTKAQIKKGEILRMVYDNTKKKNWTGTPMYMVSKRHPEVHDHLDDLTAMIDLEAQTTGGYGLITGKAGDTTLLMLRKCYNSEKLVLERLVKIIKEREEEKKRRERIIDPIYRMTTLTDDQKGAINGSLNSAVSVITGGGGSGKTTSITEVILNLENHRVNFIIVSFTGKAVVRVRQVLRKAQLSETLVEPTFTIHRAIYKGAHIPNEEVTHLIVDETSMVTTELLAEFLEVYPNIRWICAVGDCNQLLPITWGSLFTEIIASERIPVYRLTFCHRTYKVDGEEDGVLINANAIANHPPDMPFHFKEYANFKCINGDENTVKHLITSFHKAGVLDKQLTVITPYNIIRQGLNNHYQQIYRAGINGSNDRKGIHWRSMDRVVMLENNYDIDVMNGEEGRVIDVNDGYARISFDEMAVAPENYDFKYQHFNRCFLFSMDVPLDDGFGGDYKKRRKYKNRKLGNEDESSEKIHTGMVTHGYALTVHKSQGSEYDFVIFYVPPGKKVSKSFLCRNLLYTAVSRGKRAVWVVGDIPTMEKMAETRPARRFECLGEWLAESLEKTTEGIDSRFLLVGTFDPADQDSLDYFNNDDDDGFWDD